MSDGRIEHTFLPSLLEVPSIHTTRFLPRVFEQLQFVVAAFSGKGEAALALFGVSIIRIHADERRSGVIRSCSGRHRAISIYTSLAMRNAVSGLRYKAGRSTHGVNAPSTRLLVAIPQTPEHDDVHVSAPNLFLYSVQWLHRYIPKQVCL